MDWRGRDGRTEKRAEVQDGEDRYLVSCTLLPPPPRILPRGKRESGMHSRPRLLSSRGGTARQCLASVRSVCLCKVNVYLCHASSSAYTHREETVNTIAGERAALCFPSFSHQFSSFSNLSLVLHSSFPCRRRESPSFLRAAVAGLGFPHFHYFPPFSNLFLGILSFPCQRRSFSPLFHLFSSFSKIFLGVLSFPCQRRSCFPLFSICFPPFFNLFLAVFSFFFHVSGVVFFPLSRFVFLLF